MHERDPGLGLAPEEELLVQLASFFEQEGEADPRKAARTFLSDVAEYAGLLTERGPSRYGFIHLTFEEYLAAVGIAHDAEGDVEAMFEAVAERVGDPVWREPVLLLVGYVALVQQLPTIAGKLLERLVEERPGPPGSAVVAAGTALADMGSSRVAGKAREMVVEGLVETLGDMKVPAKARLEAGDVLGRLGDPRPGAGTVVHTGVEVPAIEWHEVPAGTFTMGSDDDDSAAFDWEKLAHEVRLERFWVARYPVTNAQYRTFVEAGGYDDPAWWTEAGRAWLKGEDEAPDLSGFGDEAFRERYRDWLAQRTPDLRRRPWYWHHPRFSRPSRPVVGVSWYEAQAFAAWLEARSSGGVPMLQGGESPPAGYGVRLPSEAEWEKAARGADGRRWPWGEEPSSDRASTMERELGEPSSVGLFLTGAGPFGALDQAGNVWEWTRTLWSRDRMDRPDFGYPYDPGDGREALAGSAPRILRGGSWANESRHARCASRFRNIAVNYIDDVGFRVVLSLANPDS
ncbi:MAG: SUMF1/EgtB/PvdO family nonheme iron enzyme [bacterium]|nr:SUMF1/EgtB/PvdO family nonheme iron enzyme [bacterium]